MADKLYDNQSIEMTQEKSIPDQFSDLLQQKYEKLKELEVQGQPENYRIAEDNYMKYKEIFFEYDVELTGFDQARIDLFDTNFGSQRELEEAAKKLDDHIKIAEERKKELEKEMEKTLKIEKLPPEVKLSIEKNSGQIEYINQRDSDRGYMVVTKNQKGTFDSIEISRQDEGSGWKVKIKSGYPEHEQALQHNLKLQQQQIQSKDLDFKPTIER